MLAGSSRALFLYGTTRTVQKIRLNFPLFRFGTGLKDRLQVTDRNFIGVPSGAVPTRSVTNYPQAIIHIVRGRSLPVVISQYCEVCQVSQLGRRASPGNDSTGLVAHIS